MAARRSSASAQERGAQANRLARHLFTIATTAPPGKEVRVTGIGERLVAERRAAWERWYGPVAAARWGSALWHTLAWAIFGGAYVGAVVFVVVRPRARRPAQVLLVLAAGSRLSAYIGATVGEIGFLRGFWMDGSRRLAWLEDYAASLAASADLPVPARVAPRHPLRARVVRLSRHVAAGARRRVADAAGRRGRRHRRRERRRQDDAGQAAREDVRADRPARSSSTTRRWRACRPTSGARGWPARSRISSASSSARGTRVGLGDVPRLDDEPAVSTAVDRAGADDVVARLTSGLDTQLGPTWPGGVECRSASGRSWRSRAASCATSRCCWCSTSRPRRSTPKPSTRCSSATPRRRAATGDETGRITILVSHRFSTVRMADLIVVLDGARVVEVGTHDELMAKRGQYAELYGIQAAAYR